MRKTIRIIKNEDGQVLLLVALMMVVLIGLVALTIDFGQVYVTKAKLQNAADAASLAGVQKLPDKNAAEDTAINYAGLNGVQGLGTLVTVITPYNEDPSKIEVVCLKNVQYTFARVLGFKNVDVSARAVAQKESWGGEALPFVNLNDKYDEEGDTIISWEMVGPGDKERIDDDGLILLRDDAGKVVSIKVIYENHRVDNKGQLKKNGEYYKDGIVFQKGTDASIKGALNDILDVGQTVYLFSLSNSVIDSGDYEKNGEKELKNQDVIPLDDVVLLKCELLEYDDKKLTLKFLQVYKIAEGELPGSVNAKLIE